MFATWQGERFSIGGRDIAISLLPLARLDDEFVSEWLDLERRAVEGNAFLSPHFILPAQKHLDPRKRLILLAIYRTDADGDQLIGLGVFIARPPQGTFPLPHLEAYRSSHTSLTGILLDRDYQWLALESLGAYFSSSRVPWCGIVFSERLADSALDQVYRDRAITSVVRWSEISRNRRAILLPSLAQERFEAVLADGSFGKELQSKRQRLEERGGFEWRFRTGQDITPECVETFLRLEDQGWKHEHGRSMLSQPGHAEFFREMMRNFAADGRAFFTELIQDGKVIASTSNLISGNIGFSFKIGWDSDYSAVSPRLLNELELLRQAGKHLSSLEYVDRGAAEGAFIGRLWRDHIQVTTGVLSGGYAGAAILPALSIARRLKRGFS